MQHAPILKTVARPWLLRLFSWPWRPWVASQQVRDWQAEFARDKQEQTRTVRRAQSQEFNINPPRQRVADVTVLSDVRRRREEVIRPTTEIARAPLVDHSVDRLAFLVGELTAIRDELADIPVPAPVFRSGGGGDFGGSGASGSWDAPSSANESSSSPSIDGGSSSPSSSSE
jgi:hypothetical protein